jgi:hypothetical protein
MKNTKQFSMADTLKVRCLHPVACIRSMSTYFHSLLLVYSNYPPHVSVVRPSSA